MRTTLIAGLAAGLLLVALPAAGQNTGGVFGPVVSEGHRSWQYRAGYDFDSHGFAQRFHYQHALNDDLMLRGIVQTVKTDDSRFDFAFFQGELFWQLDDLGDNWQHGVRFDVRLRSEGRPAILGFNWMNQFQLSERWMSRVLVLTATDVGDGASGDLLVQTRASVTYTATNGLRPGLEMFNVYGPIDDMPGLDRQLHQAGPTLSHTAGDNWQFFSSVLFGLSGSTPDTQARFWMTRSF